ncbi:MAG: CopG family transcriptional regulator [Candidatus Omnitrophica bacterium]|nr:CopG family transcriptional regulator [Candidatus Omnitrophota bacterium]
MKTHAFKTAKVTISLPKDTLRKVELIRGKLEIDRSAAILEAIVYWLDQKDKQEMETRYEQGYKKNPERVADVEALYRAGLESFTQEEW